MAVIMAGSSSTDALTHHRKQKKANDGWKESMPRVLFQLAIADTEMRQAVAHWKMLRTKKGASDEAAAMGWKKKIVTGGVPLKWQNPKRKFYVSGVLDGKQLCQLAQNTGSPPRLNFVQAYLNVNSTFRLTTTVVPAARRANSKCIVYKNVLLALYRV